MTPAHRMEVVLSEDGELLLDHLPFPGRAGRRGPANRPLLLPAQTLRGTVLRYDRPTDPVAEADWGALR